MIKECVVLNGKVINIGPWDYQIQRVEVEPPVFDEEGNLVKEAVYEDRVTNQLPEGAVIEEREIEIGPDGGLYVVGEPRPESPLEMISRLETENAALTLELAATQAQLEQAEQAQAELLLQLVEKGVL